MTLESRAWAGRLLMVAMTALAVVAVDGQGNQRGYASYHFVVEIDGQNAGFFRSVSGLSVETEVVDYREGGVNDIIHKLPGAVKYPNIRLSRPFTGDRSLYDWVVATQTPQPIKSNGRVRMFDQQGNLVATWTFHDAFPVKWEGPDFDAGKNEVAIETIEIAHEGLVMSDGEDDDKR